MSKSEALKSVVSVFEKIFFSLLVTLFGLISYLFINAEVLSVFKIAIACVGLVLNVVLLAVFGFLLAKNIKELERV